MKATELDEAAFFEAIARSGARALLIGRRAMVARPTSDEDYQRIGELAGWFLRRYPTARERLAYVRRAYARAVTSRP